MFWFFDIDIVARDFGGNWEYGGCELLQLKSFRTIKSIDYRK